MLSRIFRALNWAGVAINGLSLVLSGQSIAFYLFHGLALSISSVVLGVDYEVPWERPDYDKIRALELELNIRTDPLPENAYGPAAQAAIEPEPGTIIYHDNNGSWSFTPVEEPNHGLTQKQLDRVHSEMPQYHAQSTHMVDTILKEMYGQ